VKRVLIIGGYGNFGSYIARALSMQSILRRAAFSTSTAISRRGFAKSDPTS